MSHFLANADLLTALNFARKRPEPLVRTRSSSSSSDSSLKQPRTPRFAEATSVYSPIDKVSPFADPPVQGKTTSVMAQAQPSDIGFGYIAQNDEHVEVPMTPASPLKSAMKMPGATSRWVENPLSPTFREEQVLEKKEQLTEKEQAKDLVSREHQTHSYSEKLTKGRKSKPESAQQSSCFEVSTSAAVSSSFRCCR